MDFRGGIGNGRSGLLKFTYKEIPTQAVRFRFTTKNSNISGTPLPITGSASVDLTAEKPVLTSEDDTGRRPARINGHDFTKGNATEDNWKAWFKTDDWNVLEWDASQWGDEGDEKTTFESITRFNFRPFSLWDGSPIPEGRPASAAIPRIFYIDDFELIQKLPVTDEYL